MWINSLTHHIHCILALIADLLLDHLKVIEFLNQSKQHCYTTQQESLECLRDCLRRRLNYMTLIFVSSFKKFYKTSVKRSVKNQSTNVCFSLTEWCTYMSKYHFCFPTCTLTQKVVSKQWLWANFGKQDFFPKCHQTEQVSVVNIVFWHFTLLLFLRWLLN